MTQMSGDILQVFVRQVSEKYMENPLEHALSNETISKAYGTDN